MKNCFYQYRKGLVEVLETLTYEGSAIPVKQFAPINQATPFIQVGPMSSEPVDDYTSPSQEVTTDILVITSYEGEPEDYGTLVADTVMDSVMDLLITQGVTIADRAKNITMDDFTEAGCYLERLAYDIIYNGNKLFVTIILTIRTMIDEK